MQVANCVYLKWNQKDHRELTKREGSVKLVAMHVCVRVLSYSLGYKIKSASGSWLKKKSMKHTIWLVYCFFFQETVVKVLIIDVVVKVLIIDADDAGSVTENIN